MTSEMNRRHFCRLLGGAAAGLPFAVRAKRGLASTDAASKPMLFCIEAVGAYDVTLICDPRGNGGQANPPNMGYSPADITSYGNIQVAPQVPAVAQFFSAYHSQCLVINGVDTSTIDHGTGMRSSMSGTGSPNYPVTAAVVAAALGADQPAAYMSNGGYNNAANQVGLTLLGPGISDGLLTPMDGNGVHSPASWSAVQSGISARISRRLAAARAPLTRQRLQMMQQAIVGAGALAQLSQTITSLGSAVPLTNPAQAALSVDPGFALNVQVAMAGFLHGQSTSAQMAVGVFDTHSQNDAGQLGPMTLLFSLADYILRAATYLGLSEQIVIFIASDFARTPYYNSAAAGKDHWPTTSAILINPATDPKMPIGTVIGGSDDGLNAVPVDPTTLRASSSGVTIKPGHIHDALRRWYGVDQSSVAISYPLYMPEQMPLFG